MKYLMLLFTLLIFPATVLSQTATVTARTQDQTTTTTKVEYELPYPGMLPDNPLYFVKQIRDWILDKLIADPVKKADFYILQGDKRLAMGVMLTTTGKAVLGEQVISKSEKYMNNAVQQLLGAKAKGQEVPGYIVDHLTRALAKHAELVTAEIGKAADAQKAGLTTSLTLITQLQADLGKLK